MINIAICDDNSDYIDILENKIKAIMSDVDDYKIYRFTSIKQLEGELSTIFFDILFLDIMLDNYNSVEWLINNSLNKKTQVILMTGYPEEAYNISETNCCYYLIKTKTSDEQIKKAISKALCLNSSDSANYVLINIGNKNYTIDIQQVIYIESYRNNLFLYFVNGQRIVIYNTIKEFSKKLPYCFLQCHRCYVINMNHVIGFEPYRFILATEKSIPIPQKKYSSTIKKYKNYIEMSK